MNYFITGGSGFIGRRLIKKLLERAPENRVYFLMRASHQDKLPELFAFWNVNEQRAVPIIGDMTLPLLGVSATEQEQLRGQIDHFFHLAAIYDLNAKAGIQQQVNTEGTRQAVQLAERLGSQQFHHCSSIAAAGLFDGLFREDMFDEAEHLDMPYFQTKHEAEGIVRNECTIAWRIYRPGIVVGDANTGEMDKIDGPYYFFKTIQKLRRLLPPWMPAIGVEGGRINIVPVNFVVDAMAHIAHQDGEENKTFHLTDPNPMRVGDMLSTFSRAAHAPEPAIRINASLFSFIPRHLTAMLMTMTPVRRIRDAAIADLGLPKDIFRLINYPTRFDSRETQRLLKGTGIEVPPLHSYAWRLWDYWERHLDPELFIDRSLRGRVEGKVVLVTGATSGIGRATARKLAGAGAIVVTIARDEQKIAETQAEFAELGLTMQVYQGDLADLAQGEAITRQIVEEHGGVDILINNAGRSIRRSIEDSFERFHDLERTMQLNYFGALKVIMGVLPTMIEKKKGHIINISSIGVLTNAPRFSAYVASKSALDAWVRTAASEFADKGVSFSIINMPLVKTPMVAPTKVYEQVPMMTPEEAADLVCDTIINKHVRLATRLGVFGQVVHALAPRVAQVIMNTSFRTFADPKDGDKSKATADQVAVSTLIKGIHF
ncbi:short chain dehydrogenase [Aeromonas allosaccharophila]|uniref:SDR family oxidoreductase n=1 Tax=Aeromonas allosaccharophila TaxID=656 RepID=A0ABZ0F5Z5_9GAMM|nr:SDR family oxidoreductase [Aeromonas allosaccharophila]OKP45212.1 short chain dehydrogenase [Aeromonas allosaccharophila]WOE64614.1 SDR family oxidoreductase [Aeromonas allosaccharophila]